jgi:hypothetical protein
MASEAIAKLPQMSGTRSTGEPSHLPEAAWSAAWRCLTFGGNGHRLQPRELLWDLTELRAADRLTGPGGRGATISDPDGLTACLECDRRLRNLGPHLVRAHGLDAVAYPGTARPARDRGAEFGPDPRGHAHQHPRR